MQALVVQTHESYPGPNGADSNCDHVETIRETETFDAVSKVLWKEEPPFKEVTPPLETEESPVVPSFVNKGHAADAGTDVDSGGSPAAGD